MASPAWRIVEAGGTDSHFFVQMPLGYGKTFYDKSINWNYRAEPDPGLAGQSDFWPRGKMVGGSSSINAMVWIRGDRRDYDEWAQEGNPGWSFDDVLPVFKSLEDNQAGADEWRGTGGPVHVTDVSAHCIRWRERFLQAGRQAGFPANPDFNGATQEGVGVYQINTRKAGGCQPPRHFCAPRSKAANVTLMTRTLATRLLFNGNRAIGLEVERDRQKVTLLANREIILSAGAVNSPQLLELSGIGSAEILKAAGIDVKLDSPAVGHHLAGPSRHQLHVPFQGPDAQSGAGSVVGQAQGRNGVPVGFDRPALPQPQPGRRLREDPA